MVEKYHDTENIMLKLEIWILERMFIIGSCGRPIDYITGWCQTS